MPQPRIAIIGLGIAGSTAALLLARQGHHITLFEQTPTPGPVGAGILLQPSGQLVLQQLGLLDSIIAQAEPIDRLFALTHRGKTLIDLPYSELGPPPTPLAYGVHRGTLFTTLYDALRQTPTTFRLGIRATRYESHPTHATLFDDQENPLGDFDFLLACDGAQSALRTSSKIPARIHQYPHGALWAVAPCHTIRRQLWQVCRGSRRLCGILPTGQGGGCSLFWSLAKSEHDPFLTRGFDAWRTELLNLCPQAAEFFHTLHSFDQTRYTTYLHVRMPQPFDDRCLFLGDAAHAMSPHLGQGINLALLDAFSFAQSFAATPDFSTACRTHLARRRTHTRVYSTLTRLLSPFFQSQGIIKGALRDTFLPLMPRIPPLRRQMILTMSGLRKSFLGGRLTLD